MCQQKHNNLTEEQQRLFNMAVFAEIVSEDPAELRDLSTLYIAAGDEYGGPDRAFKHGASEALAWHVRDHNHEHPVVPVGPEHPFSVIRA